MVAAAEAEEAAAATVLRARFEFSLDLMFHNPKEEYPMRRNLVCSVRSALLALVAVGVFVLAGCRGCGW